MSKNPVATTKRDALDGRARDWISRSPLVFLGTCNAEGDCYTSPRGGPPGFVKVLDDRRVAFADLSGNNKINNMRNLVRSDGIAIAFIIPRANEILRIKGRAIVTTDRQIAETVAVDGVVPRVSFVVDVQEARFEISGAFKRSGVWSREAWPDTGDMPSYAQIIRDHGKIKSMTVEQIETTLKDAYGPQWLWKSGGSDVEIRGSRPFEVSVDVARSAREVFSFLSRFENETKWNPIVVDTKRSSPQQGEAGARYDATLAFTGDEMPAVVELVEITAGRRVAYRITAGPATLNQAYTITESSGVSHVVLSMEAGELTPTLEMVLTPVFREAVLKLKATLEDGVRAS